MILLAALYRLFDGLPLSASTDVDNGTAVKECQRYIKLISKKLTHLPDRCSLTLLQHHIHLISSLDVTILMLCEASYPTVLAFSFLDELQKEFILLYDKGKVHDAKRPYAFIEFDSVISKTKQRFNSPRSLSTKYNLAEKSQEIRLRPPYQIQEEDLQMSRNGLVERSTYRPTVTPGRRYVPLTVLGWTAVILCAFSSFLSLARAMAIVGQGHLNEYVDGSPYYYGALFFISSMGNVCQGILLQARPAAFMLLKGTMGTFSNASLGTRVMTCGTLSDSLTHSFPTNKSSVTVTWTPPQLFVEPVVLVATVAQNQFNWWRFITSQPIILVSTIIP